MFKFNLIKVSQNELEKQQILRRKYLMAGKFKQFPFIALISTSACVQN